MLNLITQLCKLYYPCNTTVAFLVYVFNDKDLLMSVVLREMYHNGSCVGVDFQNNFKPTEADISKMHYSKS